MFTTIANLYLKKYNNNIVEESGLASGKTVEDIAKKHNVDIDLINRELEQGIKVEHEHTKDNEKAKKIAMDHLFENPNYYTKLKKIEKQD